MASLSNKTIRPGSLNGYSYYYSSAKTTKPLPVKRSYLPKFKLKLPKKSLVAVLILTALIGLPLLRGGQSKDRVVSGGDPTSAAAVTPVVTTAANHCQGNTLPKLIKISVKDRHLWACQLGKVVFDSPVITGLQGHPETETPLGTYQIYAKQTNTTLTGTDSRGSWRDPVYYWMPFFDNQYGTYGFHDATWRPANAFGNVSPNSSDASHGCVELPLASSKWLYNWVPVHTAVSVEA